MDENRTAFVTKAEVATLVRQERDRMSSATTCISLEPPYQACITMKLYLVEYTVPNVQKFDDQRGNIIERVLYFVDAMGPFAHNPELCFREFSKSLTDRAYVWDLNLKPGSIEDWDHLVTLINAKSFCGEAKFTLAELGRTRQYLGGNLYVYVKRFCERTLDCSDAIDEETLIDVCLHDMIIEYRSTSRI